MESCLLEELSLAPGVGMDICMHAQYYDVTPFYAYPETWTENGVVVENYLNSGYRVSFAKTKHWERRNRSGSTKWGLRQRPDKGAMEQANWWARAVNTLSSDPHVEHIGVYEIRDLPLDKKAIGDEKNHYSGITYADRTKKLAFHTIAMLNDLLGCRQSHHR